MKHAVSLFSQHSFFLLCCLFFVLVETTPVFAASSYTLSLYSGFCVDETMHEYDRRVLIVTFSGDEALVQVAEPGELRLDFSPNTDLFFSFDPADSGQLVLESYNPDLRLALLDDTGFDSVDDSWLDGLDPDSGLTEIVVDPADTLIACTNDGCVKIGDITLDPGSGTVSFDYERLSSIPEPAGLALFGLGLIAMIAVKRRHKKG